MLHACFVYDPTCFMCIFIQYLAFSGTNLLTRCHSAVPVFCCFCISEKLYRKYSRNCMGQIASIIKSRNEDCVRRKPKGGSQVTRPHPGAARPWPAPGWHLGPPGRPEYASSPIYSSFRENPRHRR